MKGVILDFSIQENKGAIITEEGDRYYFSGTDWKSEHLPQKEAAVDFEANADKKATMIYLDIKQAKQTKPSSFIKTDATNTTPDYAAENSFTIAEWAKKAIENYSNFSGRARRKEFWSWVLMSLILGIVALVIDNIFGITFLFVISSLATILPSVAVTIRRLHDINMPGLLALILVIPGLNVIFSIIIGCIDTVGTDNQWGAPAKLP